MPAVADQVRQYAAALADPSRAAILTELDRLGEATVTQLAERLDLTTNNVYYHMRILRQMDLVEQTRTVPGVTYVEKYFAVPAQLRAALRLDPGWFNSTGAEAGMTERRDRLAAVCLVMSIMLRRAGERLAVHDPAELDATIRAHGSVILSINRISPEQLEHRIGVLHDMFVEEGRMFAENLSPRTEMMLLATLPSFIWDQDTPEQ